MLGMTSLILEISPWSVNVSLIRELSQTDGSLQFNGYATHRRLLAGSFHQEY